MQQEFPMEESRINQLPGQRFCPMDDELVLFYLKPMLNGENVPGRNRLVFDCDLYGHQEPWEIWEAFKNRRPHDLRLNKDIYFFTQHKKLSATDKRVRRNVGSGTWKGDDSGKPVRSVENSRVVGLKKRYTYKNEDSPKNGCWILHEFYLDRSLRDKKQKVKDYVLCLLRKNSEPKTKIEKKRKEREEEEVLETYHVCDGENMYREQEEFLEPHAKRQRTVSSIDKAPLTMPSDDDDDAESVAELEDSLECLEDYNAPTEAQEIGFQGENGGLQQSASEVQSSPSFVEDRRIFNPLPKEDFLLEEKGTVEMEERVPYGVDCNVAEENVVTNILLYDPSGSNNVCGGSEDGAYWFESMEVPTDAQQMLADEDCLDWLDSINFSPEENNFL